MPVTLQRLIRVRSQQVESVCNFLLAIETVCKSPPSMSFFHAPDRQISLGDYYVPIEVTFERRFRREVESRLEYAETEAELNRAYSKNLGEEEQHSQLSWKKAKEEYRNLMVRAGPGMGKSTLLFMDAIQTAQEERQDLVDHKKTVDDVIFPLRFRLAEFVEDRREEIWAAIFRLVNRDYLPVWDDATAKHIKRLLKEKLAKGQCLLLLDALDEVPQGSRKALVDKLRRFVKDCPCRVICTSRIVGYNLPIVADAKEVEIVPFRQPQIEAYVQKWFENAREFDLLNDKKGSAEDLLRELRNKPQVHYQPTSWRVWRILILKNSVVCVA